MTCNDVMKLAATGLVLSLAGTAAPASAQSTIYSNDFSTDAAGFSGATALATTPSGEKYLQLYNGDTNPGTGVTTLSIAPGVTGLNLSFDVYAINTTDGNGPAGGGPDPFRILIDGVEAYDVNFANYFGPNTQSFSGDLSTSGPGYSYAPQTGATAIGSLGYGSYDSTYLLSFALPDLTTSVTFVGGTNQGLGDENYGIDNVLLTGAPAATMSAVPEPAAWAMIIGGFGLIGASVRRRRPRPSLRYV